MRIIRAGTSRKIDEECPITRPVMRSPTVQRNRANRHSLTSLAVGLVERGNVSSPSHFSRIFVFFNFQSSSGIQSKLQPFFYIHGLLERSKEHQKHQTHNHHHSLENCHEVAQYPTSSSLSISESLTSTIIKDAYISKNARIIGPRALPTLKPI